MSIKTKITLSIAAMCVASVSSGALIFSYVQGHQRSLQKAEVAQTITVVVFERRFLSDEYASYGSERAKTQWLSKHHALKELLAANQYNFQDPEERELFTRISDAVAVGEELFASTVQLNENAPTDVASDLHREKVLRLSSQMAVQAQMAVSSAARLANLSSRNVGDDFQKIIFIFSIAALLLLAVVAGGLGIIWRSAGELLALDRAKSEFISLASHQLRTPPTAINWNIEALIDGTFGPVTKKQLESLSEVHDISKRMIEVVNALLNVSRLELGTFIAEPVPTDYREVAKGVIREMRPQVEAKGISLTEQFASEVPSIQADPGLARVICENIISNAVKYTPDGGSVEVSIAMDGASAILISVKDTGYGIPMAQQRMIFGKMFRASNVQDKADGTGFGLYFVRSIVEFAAGKIWFESEEGKGTAFHIRLPVAGMKKKEGTSRIK